MNAFLKIFVAVFVLVLAGCATTPQGMQKQVADAGAGAVLGGLLGYAVAGSSGAQKGAAAGAAVGAYTSSGASADSGTTASESLYKQQMEAAKNCRPGHSCLGDVLQGRMETKATQHAYEEGYREGDNVATKKVASVAECVAKNQANIDHGLPVERDCSAIAASEAAKAAGVGAGRGSYSGSGVVVTPYVSRYYTNPIFRPQYYTYPRWGYNYNYYGGYGYRSYSKNYRRGTRAWRNYNYSPSNVHGDFDGALGRSHDNYDRGRGH